MSRLLREKHEMLVDPDYPQRLEEFNQVVNPKPPKEVREAEIQRRRKEIEVKTNGQKW